MTVQGPPVPGLHLVQRNQALAGMTLTFWWSIPMSAGAPEMEKVRIFQEQTQVQKDPGIRTGRCQLLFVSHPHTLSCPTPTVLTGDFGNSPSFICLPPPPQQQQCAFCLFSPSRRRSSRPSSLSSPPPTPPCKRGRRTVSSGTLSTPTPPPSASSSSTLSTGRRSTPRLPRMSRPPMASTT